MVVRHNLQRPPATAGAVSMVEDLVNRFHDGIAYIYGLERQKLRLDYSSHCQPTYEDGILRAGPNFDASITAPMLAEAIS